MTQIQACITICDDQLLTQLEMHCSDIIARYCFYLNHSDYPMKFGDSHKFLTFRQYKVLHEENLPVEETITQTKLHQGYIYSTMMRVIYEVHGLITPYSLDILFQEERRSRIH